MLPGAIYSGIDGSRQYELGEPGARSGSDWSKALDLGLKIFGGGGGLSTDNPNKWRNEAESSGKREEKWKEAYRTANTARVADNAVIYNPPENFDPGKAFLQQGLQQGASGGGGGGGGTNWGAMAGAALGAGHALGFLGPVAKVASVALPFLCDERLKTDIAPLERSDVHDELAEMAFLVKEIRECA